jgi:2-keto-3-deoxy-galactonokinase
MRFREEIRPALGAEALPALLCGMIGSTLGWAVVPYRDLPRRSSRTSPLACRRWRRIRSPASFPA